MGQTDLKQSPLPSRKDELRSLLKGCFQNKIFSLVPFEIWRSIVGNHLNGLMNVLNLSKTCWGFRELVFHLKIMLFDLALRYRLEGKVYLSLRGLQRASEFGSSQASFHLGFAYFLGGFGLEEKEDSTVAVSGWFGVAAKRGNYAGMALYAKAIKFNPHYKKEYKRFATQAFASNDPLAIGYCYFYGLETKKDYQMGLLQMQKSAESGDEFGQYEYAICLKDLEQRFVWMKKSAEQGLAPAQCELALYYIQGLGCKKDEELANFWLQKAILQRPKRALQITMKK